MIAWVNCGQVKVTLELILNLIYSDLAVCSFGKPQCELN